MKTNKSCPGLDASVRASLLEAIHEARREAGDTTNHETTRAYWNQKADRWQKAMDARQDGARVFGEPSDEEFEPRDHNDADGVQTMRDCQ